MINLMCFSLLVHLVIREANGHLGYCKIKCREGGYEKHTMCTKHYQPGGGEHCNNTKVKITSEEIKDLVKYINEQRNLVALGEWHNLPKASNMIELHWDIEAATIAGRWAEQCDMVVKDQCRTLLLTSRDEGGQCLSSLLGKNTERLKSIKEMVNFWFIQGKNLTGVPHSIDVYQPSSDEMAHFTQLVWAQTDRIGCGLAQTDTNRTEPWGEVKFKLVCNLYAEGNIADRVIYKRGPSCSACPPMYPACSDTYQGLCTKMPKSPSSSSRLQSLEHLGILIIFLYIKQEYF